jgi:hypothetical protein
MTDTRFDDLEISAVSNDVYVQEDTPGKSTCPDCGKLLTITAAGELRKHKCVNDISTADSGGGSHHKATVKRPRTPSTVRNLGVAIIGAGVEYGTAASLSRWVDCHPSEVPADLGDDADVMIGPVLDAIWPRVPKRGQRIIKALADESDLIMCGMAWWEWGKNLKEWGDRYIATREKAETETPTRGFQDGEQIPGPVIGNGPAGPFEPFTPNAVGNPLM